MVIVTATLQAKAGQEGALLALIDNLILLSRQDAGYVHYDCFQSHERLHTFLILEQWETLDDLERHFEQSHFRAFVRQVVDLVETPPQIDQFQVVPLAVTSV